MNWKGFGIWYGTLWLFALLAGSSSCAQAGEIKDVAPRGFMPPSAEVQWKSCVERCYRPAMRCLDNRAGREQILLFCHREFGPCIAECRAAAQLRRRFERTP